MPRKLLSGTGLALLAVLFLVFNGLNHALFSGVRLDITENKRYTLSDGSKQLLDQLDEPIDLYFYFSDQAVTNMPAMRSYAQEVRDLLREYELHGGDSVRLHVVNPEPFSEQEERAAVLGLRAVPTGQDGRLYFGLAATNSIGQREVIPFFHPDRGKLLEYDISKLIHGLLDSERPVVGLISGLPMSGSFAGPGGAAPPWQVYREADELFELRELELPLEKIKEDIDVLWLVQPQGLTDADKYLLDQYFMRGGRAVVFVDSSSGGMATAGNELEELMAAWGVSLDVSQVVLDPLHGLPVTSAMDGSQVRHPGMLGLTGPRLVGGDVLTAQLNQLNFGLAGAFSWKERPNVRVTPLVQSSEQARLVDAMQVRTQFDPSRVASLARTGDTALRTLALRLEGKLPSAFADGPPEGVEGEDHLGKASEEAGLILVADTDLLMDNLWVQTRRVFGQQLIRPFADNGDLVAGALEQMGGGEALLNVRSRAVHTRPFERINQLQMQAASRFQAKERELEQRLAETERKLAELRTGEDGRSIILSAEQREALRRFQQEQLRIRKELREVRYQLNRDINVLQGWLTFANIGMVPVLVAAFGIGVGGMRLRRRQRIRRDDYVQA